MSLISFFQIHFSLSFSTTVIVFSRFLLGLWSAVSEVPGTEDSHSSIKFTVEQTFGGSLSLSSAGSADEEAAEEDGESHNDNVDIEEAGLQSPRN